MDYYDLGTHSRTVTTSSPTAQLWFGRGLVWIYAYNHEEAIVCFQKALEADPECAMAHWGIAYGIGPNYNKPWEAFEDDEKPDALAQARDAIAQASQLKDKVTPVERALIEGIEDGLNAARPGALCEHFAQALFDALARHGLHKDSRCGYSIGLSYPPDWGERTQSGG